MENLSKVLIVALVVCLVVIGGYGGYIVYSGWKIGVAVEKCSDEICKVGEKGITSFEYKPMGNMCLCFANDELVDIEPLYWRK